MSDKVRVTAEIKDTPNVRKLARALLLLAEKQASEAKQKAEQLWSEQYAG